MASQSNISMEIEGEPFYVDSVEIQEVLSQGFTIQAKVHSEKFKLDLERFIDKTASFVLTAIQGRERYFHGHVLAFEQTDVRGSYAAYNITIGSWLNLLEHHYDCRIFQDKSVVDIVAEVFGSYNFDKSKLTKQYSPRNYCVQYNESDAEFAKRLLADEGIAFFFEATKDTHTLVLVDDAVRFQACSIDGKVKYIRDAEKGANIQEARIGEWTRTVAIVHAKYATRDFSFEHPSADLHVDARTKDTNDARELFEWPGLYKTSGEGAAYARMRADALESKRVRIRGTSNARGFTVGHVFSLSDHFRDDGRYLFVQVRHRAAGNPRDVGGRPLLPYENTFICIPADTPFRPER